MFIIEEYSAVNEKRYDSNSYTFDSKDLNNSNPKLKFSMVLKCTVAVLTLVVVSVGVVKVYKFLNASKNELIEFSGDNLKSVARNITESQEEKESDSEDKELPSLIELAARSDAKPIPDIVDSIMPSVVGVASSFEYTPRQTFSIWGWSEEPQTELKGRKGTYGRSR